MGWGFGVKRTLILQRLVPARQWLPRDAYFWVKALLLSVIAVQLAMLVWTLVTPLGPLGRWMPPAPQALPAAAQNALLTGFNPFDRNASGPTAPAAAPVASGEYKLFGTRAAGGGLPGSAILSGPDGQQVSVSVGEEVSPGVRLVEVGFDHVVLERGGQQLRVAMDEEPTGDAAAPAGAAPAGAPGAAAPANAPLTPQRLRENIAFAPRASGGKVTGLLVSSLGDESVMQAAGLRSGDVIVAVNGRRITSAADAAAIQAQVGPGARLSLTVERGAATVPVALNLAGT